MKLTIVYISVIVSLLCFSSCDDGYNSKDLSINYDSLIIKLNFIDDVQYTGQTIVITKNLAYIENNPEFIYFEISDTTLMKKIYNKLEQCSVKNDLDSVKTIVYGELINIDTSKKFKLKNLYYYLFFKSIYCIYSEQNPNILKNYYSDLRYIRLILGSIDNRVPESEIFNQNSFGLDTFCNEIKKDSLSM